MSGDDKLDMIMNSVNATNMLVQDIGKKQSEHSEQVKRLNTAVLGDDDAGIPGLADRVTENEATSDLHAANFTKLKTVGGVLSVLWFGVLGILALVKDHLIAKT